MVTIQGWVEVPVRAWVKVYVEAEGDCERLARAEAVKDVERSVGRWDVERIDQEPHDVNEWTWETALHVENESRDGAA